jgi:hypothetical protein
MVVEDTLAPALGDSREDFRLLQGLMPERVGGYENGAMSNKSLGDPALAAADSAHQPNCRFPQCGRLHINSR